MTTERPLCKPCTIALTFPEYRLFNPACLHCGVRIIQRLGKMPIPESECIQRRRNMLAVWVEHGHSESVIRDLVKGPMAIGPVQPLVQESQAPQKRR